MNALGIFNNRPVPQAPTQYDLTRIRHVALEILSIERFLNESYDEIRATIAGLANDILRLGNPRTRHIIPRWDLQRVQIDVTGTIFKPHSFMDAFQDGNSDRDIRRQIYAPVITIPLPRDVLATDKRVKLFRDALLYDDSREFRGPHGVPLRHHPVYSQFTIEFINPQAHPIISSKSLWCPSTSVYLPDPDTFFKEEQTRFRLHDTWDAAGLTDWGSRYKAARTLFKKQVMLQASEPGDENTTNGGAPHS